MVEEAAEGKSRPKWIGRVAVFVGIIVVLIVAGWVYTTYISPGAGKPPGKGGPGIELGTSKVKLQPLTIPPLELVPVIQMQRPTVEPGTQPLPTAEPELQPYVSGEVRCIDAGGFNGIEILYKYSSAKGDSGSSGSSNPQLKGECAGQGSEPPFGLGSSSSAFFSGGLKAGAVITYSFTLTTTTGATNVERAYEMWTDGKLYER